MSGFSFFLFLIIFIFISESKKIYKTAQIKYQRAEINIDISTNKQQIFIRRKNTKIQSTKFFKQKIQIVQEFDQKERNQKPEKSLGK